jgi:hypothetical protein
MGDYGHGEGSFLIFLILILLVLGGGLGGYNK